MSKTKATLKYLIVLLIIPTLAFSQSINISGVIKDDSQQLPIVGATIVLKGQGKNLKTNTNEQGIYTINDVPAGEYTLAITAYGYENKSVTSSISASQTTIPPVLLHAVSTDVDMIATISLSDAELKDNPSSNISGVLSASRDPFAAASAFTFSTARFRNRGYQNEDLNYMNGLPMEDLVNGRGLFGTWGGLNDVIRSRESVYGLNPSNYGYGGLDGSNSIDSKASKQRKQLQVSYATSNRTYTNRLMATYGTGIMKGGWSFAASISRRWADEGYVAGTFYNGWSWYTSLEKKFNTNHSLSLTQFGANTENGRSTSCIQEAYDLAGSNYYNPTWGYQNGEKRNASVGHQQSPLTILNHEWKLNSKSDLETSVGYQFGSNSFSGLDWFNAPDPRPDFYRKLPSFILDPIQAAAIAEMWRNDESVRQINWGHLYDVNQNNFETITDVSGITGNNITGKRSKYIVEERVTDTKRISFASTYNNTVNDHLVISAGVNYQYQETDYYKRVNDLLGGDFYVDVNQFAEQEFPDSVLAIQNNLQDPNRLLHVGDKFGYSYRATVKRSGVWIQPQFKFNKIDFFIGTQFNNTSFFRTGFYQNGVFANNSIGEAPSNDYSNISLKGGITYKFDGRNYLFVNVLSETRPPLFEDVYISPRTRNTTLNADQEEKILSIEGGYLLRSPKTKVRITGYYTQINDAVNTINFYHEDYRTFVNYTLNNIDKRHTGVEIGAEQNLGQGFSGSFAAGIGQHYYADRFNATITQDNNNTILLDNEVIYSKDFFVANGPQSAYTAGLRYRGKSFWSISLNANYFDNIYLDFNPTRRTIEGVAPNSSGPIREGIIDQVKEDGQFTLDLFASKSWKLNNYWKSLKGQTFFLINVGVNNILNNQELVTGGFEQLRFDFTDKNINKFPPRRFYAFGTNYFINFILRFN